VITKLVCAVVPVAMVPKLKLPGVTATWRRDADARDEVGGIAAVAGEDEVVAERAAVTGMKLTLTVPVWPGATLYGLRCSRQTDSTPRRCRSG